MYGKKRELKSKTPQQALETARWLCSKMERSSADIRRSLVRWGVSDLAQQQEIVETLRAESFIDHQRYADCYVREKMSTGRWGVTKIVFSLRQKGIEEDTIKEAIENNINKSELNQNLEKDLRKRIVVEREKAKNAYDLRARLFRRAAARGYDIDDINHIINQLIKDED